MARFWCLILDDYMSCGLCGAKFVPNTLRLSREYIEATLYFNEPVVAARPRKHFTRTIAHLLYALLFASYNITHETSVVWCVVQARTHIVCSLIHDCAHLYSPIICGVYVCCEFRGGANNYQVGTRWRLWQFDAGEAFTFMRARLYICFESKSIYIAIRDHRACVNMPWNWVLDKTTYTQLGFGLFRNILYTHIAEFRNLYTHTHTHTL